MLTGFENLIKFTNFFMLGSFRKERSMGIREILGKGVSRISKNAECRASVEAESGVSSDM